MATWDLFHLEDNFSDFIPFFIKFTEKKWKIGVKIANGNFRYYSLAAWMLRIDPVFLEFTYQITGGPSSSWEMMRNNSQGGIIRVCMGIFTTALRNKKIRQILKKKYLTLLPQCIACYLTAYFDEKNPFSDLFISRFSTYIRKAKKSQNILPHLWRPLPSTETTCVMADHVRPNKFPIYRARFFRWKRECGLPYKIFISLQVLVLCFTTVMF